MSTIKSSKADLIVGALGMRSLMTTEELEALGVSREYLRLLAQRGRIERVSQGLYRLPDASVTAQYSIAEAARRIPNGVVCLMSALRVHNVTTQSPFEVWMAVESGAWRQQPVSLRVRLIWPKGAAYHEGIEHVTIEGVDVPVYSLAKTVADCFKYRNKIGLDVALEALRESLKDKRVSADDLWRYANICRVSNIMRPYLEAIQ